MTTPEEAQSALQLQQGGLPVRAQRRLAELGASKNHIFTSTMSPSEGVVAKSIGISPISQVMGSSIYHVGFAGYVSTWSGGELTALTHAHERARLLALSRMEQEAMLLRAHAVVDVKFISRGYSWGGELIEYTAVGTAVRADGVPPPERPALTLLRVDEFAKLRHAGYWPLGIAMGNCFWFDPHCDCMADGAFYSCELPGHTYVSRMVRDHAVERFRASTQRFNAAGVLGVRVHRSAHQHEEEGHRQMHMELMIAGTAVVRRGDAGKPPRPLVVVDLRDKAQTVLGE